MSTSHPSVISALRDLVEEDRRALGDDHPDIEEWVAFRAGHLEAGRAEILRDHLSVCRECADLVLDLAAFTASATPEGTSPVSDAQVQAALWQIQAELGHDPPRLSGAGQAMTKPAALPVVIDRRSRRPHPFWRSALAAGLAAAVVGLLLWNLPSRFRGGSDGPQPRVYASAVRQGFTLETRTPPRAGVRSGSLGDSAPERKLTVGRDYRLAVELPATARRYSELRVSVVSLPGGMTEFGADIRLVGRENLVLELPRGALSAGRYQVRIEGLEGGATKELVAVANLGLSR